jgi:integrase
MDGIFRRNDREGYFISWIDAQGRRRKRKAKSRTLEGVRNERAAELTRVAQHRILGFAAPTGDSFSEVADRFLKHQQPRVTVKTYERETWIVEHMLKPFFPIKLAMLRRSDIQRYVTARKASPATIQKELNTLKHLLRLAVEWELIPANPAQGVRAPKAPPGRVRYLQPTELAIALQACPSWLRPIVTIAVSTGMRRSEILNMRWLDLDLANGRILLPQTKNGEGRIVYLNDSASFALRSLPSGLQTPTTDKLFLGVTPERVSMAFQRACRSVGILDFRFHDLRHTAASWLRMSGADIHTVAQLLGHKDLRMAIRYQHLSPSFLADAVTKLDNILGLSRSSSIPAEVGAKTGASLAAVN